MNDRIDRKSDRAANLLIKQHGQDAPIHAAIHADAMLEKGDLDGYAVFKRVVKATAAVGRLRIGLAVAE